MATWRKVHLGGEVWEWQTGKDTSSYVIIRSPSKAVFKVLSHWLGAVKEPTRKLDDVGRPIMAYAVKPGLVKAYIESHRDAWAAKAADPGKRRRRP